MIARRAYREAMEAGDDLLADRAIVTLDAARAAPPDAILFSYARAVRAGDKKGAAAILTRIGAGPFDFVAGLLGAWAVYDAGGDPVAKLAESKSSPVARRYMAENRALLLIATDKVDEGAIALQALLGADQASLDLRINAAELLAAKGRADISRALLSGSDSAVVALRRTIGRGVPPSSAFGASRVFARLAADLSEGDPTPIVTALMRASLRLDPDNDRVRILLARALVRGGASERALALLDQVKPSSPFHESALEARVSVLSNAGEDAGALAAATALSNRKDATSADAVRMGDLLTSAGRFEDAARAYSLAIRRAGDTPSWTLFLQLGGTLDQAGRWPEARKALERAVEMAPEEPVALNYLGYARLEHGEDPAISIKLLEKANALQPGDASIIDSLAWAYFQHGDTRKAVPMLELAARGQPANATINEHLGDAYWSLGRRYEARYAWQAAAIVADAKDGPRIAAKIADGVRVQP
ncbi:tetratricopeptide repeat protein [Sphingomonas sp. QA11]|uniref:tetratricopeptide repeat protein n=1 Tax=Sphingomonas sp. QA11 TaxID=2950605 RepID=UPI00234BBF00|nr:tetratricopeptide repeat protein [Sphingomonas sp. QA11]WCM28971.1 tetratricopeptide repeat protein [Sphingomonas sp. QA11]